MLGTLGLHIVQLGKTLAPDLYWIYIQLMLKTSKNKNNKLLIWIDGFNPSLKRMVSP